MFFLNNWSIVSSRSAPATLIMIASICGLTTSAGFGAYNASKHGVIGLMRTLANELGSDDITVNAICPGWVRTPMLDASVADAGAEGSDLGEFTSMSIVERLVEPEEVTDAVIWLASPGARMAWMGPAGGSHSMSPMGHVNAGQTTSRRECCLPKSFNASSVYGRSHSSRPKRD